MVNDATGTTTKSYDWDVYNRMVKSTVESSDSSIVVSTYLYDHTGRRIMKETMSNTASGSTTSTSIYPFSDYEVTDSGSTKVSVSANNLHVATINSQPSTINQQPSTNIFFSHTDHLGGGNVMTDEQGNFAQALDYFPFGSVRIDEQYADLDERKKFTGHELDDETNLYYAQARYYDSEIGRFISQDPLQFRPMELMQKFSQAPQAFNFYSYVGNNPIVKIDPKGESAMYSDLMSTLNFLDEKTDGYIARDIQKTFTEIKDAAIAAASTAAITIGIVAAPEAVGAVLTSPEGVGAMVNMGERAYSDYQDDGVMNDPISEYGISAGFGALGGKMLSNTGIVKTTIGAGVLESAENAVIDGNFSQSKTTGNMIGAGATRALLKGPVGDALKASLSPGLINLAEGVSELITTIGASEAIQRSSDKKRN